MLAGMDLGPGDEIVTSDQEHPGLLGPLIAARDRGATCGGAVRASSPTRSGRDDARRLLARAGSRGEVAPAALAEVDVPVILDGAQGAGAVPVDVRALGCAAYAAAGQKWLCGADGTGMLYVSPAFARAVRADRARATCASRTPRAGLDSPLKDDGRRYDTPSLAREVVAFSLAALEAARAPRLDDVHARAAALAAGSPTRSRERGRTVAPRGDTTLVAWEDADPRRRATGSPRPA